MVKERQEDPIAIRKFFAGKGVLVTGSTGFLAKALVEKILRDLPETGMIYLLIRPRPRADGSLVSAEERLREELLRNSVFSRLREAHGTRFEAFCQERIQCVPGDLTHERLGLSEEAYAKLTKNVQIFIHSAATVVFDERLDLALEINTLAPLRLVEIAQASKKLYGSGVAYAHVSTAYVSGMRKGQIPERLLEPLEAIDAQLAPGLERPKKFELAKELERLKTLCKIVSADCETQARKNGWDEKSEEARTALRRALVGAGMRRSRDLGWNDTYTYTKFLGEQLVKEQHGELPTVIVRPSIIESSLREPEPGWLDGLRMADPLIVGYGKGRLDDFPAGRNVVLDIIPADFVVNATLAAVASVGAHDGNFDLLHVASSSENPLVFEHLYSSVRDYFQKHPMLDKAGKPVPVPDWKFPSVSRFRRRITYGYLKPMKLAHAIVDSRLPVPGARRWRNRLRTLNNAMEQLLYYVDIYSPYTNLDCRFETKRGRELMARMDPAERELFDFDPRKIPWKHYLQDVHIPGIKRNILRMEDTPRAGAGEGHLLDEEASKGRARSSTAIHGVPQTIVELAARGADRFGNHTFLEMTRKAGPRTGSFKLSYAELFTESARLARILRTKLSLAAGDRVVLWSENCPEWPLAWLSIVRAGGVVVPLDRQLRPAEAAQLTRFVEAKAAIVSPALLATAGDDWAAGQDLPPRLNLLDIDLAPHAGDAFPYPDAAVSTAVLPNPTPETLASLLFTSGTTLAPKGVMLTHGNFTSNALAVAEVLEPLATDRFLSVLPLHHAFEFTGGLLTPMFGGSTVHYVETIKAKDVLETMRGAGVTVMLGVPRLFQLFASGIQDEIRAAGVKGSMGVGLMATLASAAEAMGSEKTRKKLFSRVHAAFGGKLRLFVSGGAALDPDLFHFFKRFGFPVAEGYGLTETAPILTVNPIGAPRAGSVGVQLPGVELRVRQPDLQGVGEIVARGPNLMHGYWRDAEATAKVFEEGWFRTGDLGRFDKDGYLFITGRVKDVIVSAAGKKIYPDEIEHHFRALEKAKEYCVVGLPARQGTGEEVTLVVVATENDHAALKAQVENLNASLPQHQRVARIELRLKDLPKTSTLKVQRSKVREEYAGGKAEVEASAAPGAAPASGGGLFEQVAKAISEVVSVPLSEITPESKLQLDLGMDSIGRVDLVGKLELRLNVVITDEAASKLGTVRDLVDACAAAGNTAGVHKTSGRGARKDSSVDVHAAMGGSVSKTLLQGAMQTSAKALFNIYMSIDARGLENLPTSGPFLLAANHSSHLDTAAIREVLGPRRTNLHVMGARDYFFDTRLKGWFFSNAFNVLPFEREDNTLEGLTVCRAALDGGKALLIFPEGTRSVTGKLQNFKAGIGILALELDVPTFPAYVHGTFDALPKGRALPRPARVQVRFGPAVNLAELKEQKGQRKERDAKEGGREGRFRGGNFPPALYRQAAERIQAAVQKLADS